MPSVLDGRLLPSAHPHLLALLRKFPLCTLLSLPSAYSGQRSLSRCQSTFSWLPRGKEQQPQEIPGSVLRGQGYLLERVYTALLHGAFYASSMTNQGQFFSFSTPSRFYKRLSGCSKKARPWLGKRAAGRPWPTLGSSG